MCAPTTLVKHDLLGDALSGVSPTGTTNASGAKQIIEMFFINPDVSPTNETSSAETVVFETSASEESVVYETSNATQEKAISSSQEFYE